MNAQALKLVLLLLLAAATARAEDAAAATPGVDFLKGRFEFGSYGRIGIGSDLSGQLGRSANVVAHGPRLIEDGYAELELRREDDWGTVKSRVVSTVAFFPPFFHFDGKTAQSIGLRNLYAEASVGDFFSAWAGSRMYRGDDIYLLNFWPLDDLNTVGGGIQLAFGKTKLRFHTGMQRLDLPTQYQVVQNDNPVGYGSVGVARLDRPRIIESLKLSHELTPSTDFGVRLSLYAEVHELAGGVRRDTTTGDEQALPADWGMMVGGQVTAWAPNGKFAHLWVRQTVGLATYDELTMPTVLGNDLTSRGAHSTRLAIAGGWDMARVGFLVGAYLDAVRDAGVSNISNQKYDEGALSARMQWYATKYFGLAVEASHQRRTYSLVDAETGALRSGSVTQLGLMPYFSPLGQGLFNRPQLRLVYALSVRDAGARSFYAVDDPFSRRGVEHYIGINVEWWFNATTYPVR